MMKFGINSFLLTSGFTNDDLPIIEQFKAWGADMAEFAAFDPEQVDAAALRLAIEAAGMENCPVCGIWPEDRDLRGTEEAQQNSLAYTGKLIDLASEIGSKIVAGPMYSCVGRCELHTDAERATQSDTIDKVGSPALKIHADTFHMNIEENNPAEAIRSAGDHKGHMHASGSHRGIPGTGHVDWIGIFAALKDIAYDGDICIETFSTDNDTIARAVSLWIQRFDSPQQLALEGLSFLREAWDRAQGAEGIAP
jgi:D-psicose/D-tagatose/L-ribulose 3-epimerase